MLERGGRLLHHVAHGKFDIAVSGGFRSGGNVLLYFSGHTDFSRERVRDAGIFDSALKLLILRYSHCNGIFATLYADQNDGPFHIRIAGEAAKFLRTF
jgi:hypothetical protein